MNNEVNTNNTVNAGSEPNNNDLNISNIQNTTSEQNQNVFNTLNINNDFNFKKGDLEKKGLFIKIGIGILIVLILAVGFLFWFNSPKNIMLRSANKIYNNLTDVLNKYKSSKISTLAKDNTIVEDGTVTVKVDDLSDSLELPESLNNFSIKFNNAQDQKNEEMLLKLNANIVSGELLNLVMYTKKDIGYLYVKEMFDKYLIIKDSKYLSTNINESSEEISYLVDKGKNSFFNNLKSSDFKKSKAELNYNDESHKVSKITLSLTDKRIKEISKEILIDFKNDKKSIEYLANLMSSEDTKTAKDEIIKLLNDSIDELDEKEELLEGGINISIYTKGITNDAVKYEISDYSSDIVISCLSYEKDKNTISDIEIKNAGGSFKLKLVKNDNNTTFEMYNNDFKFINGRIVNELKEIKANKEYKNIVELKMNMSGIVEITVNGESTINVGAKINKPDVSNAVDVESLTEEEQLEVTDNLNNLLLNIFEKLSE